jgi:hypothetical protein
MQKNALSIKAGRLLDGGQHRPGITFTAAFLPI